MWDIVVRQSCISYPEMQVAVWSEREIAPVVVEVWMGNLDYGALGIRVNAVAVRACLELGEDFCVVPVLGEGFPSGRTVANVDSSILFIVRVEGQSEQATLIVTPLQVDNSVANVEEWFVAELTVLENKDAAGLVDDVFPVVTGDDGKIRRTECPLGHSGEPNLCSHGVILR